MSEEYILELEHINKAFPGVKALDDVSLSIRRGEVRGLVGENGAGKSTLMKILTGVYPKDSGTIKIDGEEGQDQHAAGCAEAGTKHHFPGI